MNKKLDYRLLRRLYSIHSPSSREEKMIRFLISYIKGLPGKIKVWKDAYGNLYAKKGRCDTYPCIVAHVDQVQKTHSSDFRAIETRDMIFGYSMSNHQFEGLGADDKNGVLICLEALKSYDAVKVAFFREEEIGCGGSSNADMNFFNDCQYVIQCDRRGNSDLITSVSFTELCSEEFIHDLNPVAYGYKEWNGLMTDVVTLKENGLNISCVNMSCGYYNPHTDEEITVKRDLEKCWNFVQHIIEDCTQVYPHEPAFNSGLFYGWEYDLEDEVHSILDSDSDLTGNDLYDMYHTNFPCFNREDFGRIVEEHRMLYQVDEDDKEEHAAKDGGCGIKDFIGKATEYFKK